MPFDRQQFLALPSYFYSYDPFPSDNMASQQETMGEKPSLSVSLPQDAASTALDPDDETYPTGAKLAIILLSLGLVILLMALDVSVIATVSSPLLLCQCAMNGLLTNIRLSLP